MKFIMDDYRLNRLWRSRKTILEILEKRKYDISDLEMTKDEFMAWCIENEYHETPKEMSLECEGENGRIKVYRPCEVKLGGPHQKIISSDMDENNITRAIIVIEDSVTSQASSIHTLLRSKGVFIDVFTISETQINVSRHSLVPEHIICTPSEKKKVLDIYKLKSNQLPRIKQTDIQVKILGASRGQLIKLIDNSQSTPGYKVISYRLVAGR